MINAVRTIKAGLIAAVVVTCTSTGWAQQHSSNSKSAGWAVTVVHTVDIYGLLKRMTQNQNVRVGIIGAPLQNPVNVTTGLVIDGDGHILTRLNEVDPENTKEDISVVFSDGSSAKAKLIGIDGPTGFSVLKVDVQGEAAPAFAEPSRLSIGYRLKILSSDVPPQENTAKGQLKIKPLIRVLAAKVSANNIFASLRGILMIDSTGIGPRNDSAIATSEDSRVIGMIQSTGMAEGVAYLFPIDLLENSVARRILAKNGSVPSGWLGVSGMNVTQLSKDQLIRLGASSGVVVTAVQPSSTAEEYGMKPEDVIVGIDKVDVAGVVEMGAALASYPAGQEVYIRALRAGKPIDFKMVLGAKPATTSVPIIVRQSGSGGPESPTLASTGDATGSPSSGSVLTEARIQAGFIARDLTRQLALYFGATGGGGVYVTSVIKGSRAQVAGLTAGDVILGGQQEAAFTVAQLKSMFDGQTGPINLKVLRNRQEMVVSIPAANGSENQ